MLLVWERNWMSLRMSGPECLLNVSGSLPKRYLFGWFLLHCTLTQSYTSSFHLYFVFQDIWILNKCILSRIEKRIFRLTCFARNLIDFRILTLHLFILAVQNLSKFERISCNEKMQYTLTYNIAVFTSILIPLKWVGKVKH